MAQPETAGWGLPQLMHDLAQVRSAKGRFVERKTIHVLNAPLVASGTLTYVAPNYLQKKTSSPVPENFVLDHGEVTITGGPDNLTQSFSLTGEPQIAGLVEGIRATLAGDLPMLERYYTVQLTGNETAWQLYLRPREAALTRFVAWILIRGSRNFITAIDTASSTGDHSEMGIITASSNSDHSEMGIIEATRNGK